jgi:glycosyltransferase involved in cell wall biosynthesis
MKLAFDVRCEADKYSSFKRVLELWRNAANAVGLEFSEWDGNGYCHADVLMSPNSDVATIKGPIKVATLHDVNPIQPQPSSWLQRAPSIYALRKTARNLQLNADHIITGCEFAKQSISHAFPALKDKLFVVPHYPSPAFTPGEVDQQLLKQHGLPEHCVLFVSAIRKHKNWDGLLNAWLKLPEKLQSAHPLVFVASAKKVKRKINSPHVIFTERIDDQILLHLYRSAKVMVFPSFAEGFGLPPLEALACDCDVIASNATCLPEVLGDAVSYFDPHHPNQLSDLLLEQLSTPRLKNTATAPAWSAELTGNKLISFLDSI